eukprot:TRINITY_DN8317_c0_g1_i3.p2 TRINITY_DN8317_c0_g1~~TRINITY_DN8317_c0_g1_i3.p2  ORF type:complete len:108 (+),score=8.32 TRINITY_DN8317_c0_g1_i3:688-1011(+)
MGDEEGVCSGINMANAQDLEEPNLCTGLPAAGTIVHVKRTVILGKVAELFGSLLVVCSIYRLVHSMHASSLQTIPSIRTHLVQATRRPSRRLGALHPYGVGRGGPTA